MPFCTASSAISPRARPSPATNSFSIHNNSPGEDVPQGWRPWTLSKYKRAFAEEPGKITAIGIMTDTDNTGENVHAYYGDIQFRRILAPKVGHLSE